MSARAAATLMIQGTASHVGKSVLTAALGRLFTRAGRRVAPFKAQNLSLNAVVAAGVLPGEPPGEIGWAQALQALACRVAPSLDMNPVLLKPTRSGPAGGGCQLVVRGRAVAMLGAGGYGRYPEAVVEAAAGALARLRAAHDLVLLEGAGSPAEINLLERDFANRWAAQAADAPILLVGDISRGGVFAALLGTWMLSPHPERIRGFIVNQLHGGGAALEPGLLELERRTGVPTLGVVPWRDPELPEEDSAALDAARPAPAPAAGMLRIGVVRLPHIANFTDFDTLARTSGLQLFYSWSAEELRSAHVLILPGSKSTVSDLGALRAAGLDRVVLGAAAAGKPVVGICGGYQMMGRVIRDRHGVESDQAEVAGLGLLPVETDFVPEKRTAWVRATASGGAIFHGYVIQAGRTRRLGGEACFKLSDGGEDGCRYDRMAGTALHGVLPCAWVAQWRTWAGLDELAPSTPPASSLEQRLDAWSDHVAAHLNWERVQTLVPG